MIYLALLRGVNVGGNAKVPMAELKTCFENLGHTSIKTFINSGNVIFKAKTNSVEKLTHDIEQCLEKKFGWKIDCAVYDHDRYKKLVNSAPKEWGERSDWKHNALFLLPPYDMKEAIASIGTLKPDIETLVPGDGVLYQSMSKALFGRTTTGKLASMPIYKRMTIRNYNTTTKLLKLMDEMQ